MTSRLIAENPVLLDYHAVLVFLITGVAMVCTPLIAGMLFRPKNPYPEKTVAYECAEDPVGEALVLVRCPDDFDHAAALAAVADPGVCEVIRLEVAP